MKEQETEGERMSSRRSSRSHREERVSVNNVFVITNFKDLMGYSEFQNKRDSRLTS